MKYRLRHETVYKFDRPVFLEPHVIRLRPRSDSAQKLLSFDIKIEPKPVGSTEYNDLEGNSITHCWFDELTGALRITTAFEIETLRDNPFDYLLDDDATRLPIMYGDAMEPLVAAYRSSAGLHQTVAEFSGVVARQAKGETLPFLAELNRRIYQTCACVIREEGDPLPAEFTLAEKSGSCRDLAVLFIAACRAQGIAARFVSGYQEGDPDQEKRYLHAWAEVYLPGAGWRGYDPTHGLPVGDRHIALAASVTPALSAPVSGSYRGTGIAAGMQAEIDLRIVSGTG